MKIKFIPTLTFILLTNVITCQAYAVTKTLQNQLAFYGNYSFSSNAITNQIAKNYYLGKFITDEIKNNVIDNLKSKNNFGINFFYGINAQFYIDSIAKSKGWSIRTGINNATFINAKFSSDLFKLYFNGNKQFADKTAQLYPFILNQLTYQSFELGLTNSKKSKNGEHAYFFGLNIFKGQNFNSIQSNQSTLYTAANGAYLDLDMSIKIHQSDSSQKKIYQFNGLGAGIDLYYCYKNNNGNSFALSINDLGYMRWNKNTNHIRSNKKFRFEGIDVSELFMFNDTIATYNFNNDSLKYETYLDQKEKKVLVSVIPAKFSVEYNRVVSERIQITFIAFHYLNSNFKPSISITPQYIIRKFIVWSNFTYGGYENFNAGIGAGVKLKTCKIFVSDNYLLNQIKKNGTAQGASLSLLKYF